MLTLLITLLIVLIVIGLAWWVLSMIPLPPADSPDRDGYLRRHLRARLDLFPARTGGPGAARLAEIGRL
jgi:hypothetical protein